MTYYLLPKMAYPETIKYLESFIDYEKIPAYPYKESLKLERIRGFLAAVDNPQNSLKAIHVAGTKGKGSTCAFLTYILRAAGFRTGLYTSPHLADFRERIRILEPRSTGGEFEGMIKQHELSGLVSRLKPTIEKYNQNSPYGPLSFFELYTVLAFVYFKEKKVDFAVLETGLGGRLDATNVVNSLACVITPLSYEHTQKLGNSLSEIAAEKAGIIKKSSIVVSVPQEKEARVVIRNRCREVGAKLFEIGRDIFFEETQGGFNVLGVFGEYPGLKVSLLGQHQIINATAAVGVIDALRFYHAYINTQAIRNGLAEALWPGRCEVISKSPLIVLDGAQNIASAVVLKKAIKENFKYKKLILILGISSDKDIKGICRELFDLADKVVLTSANNPRAAKPEILAAYFKGKETEIARSVAEAKQSALSKAKGEDLILVAGSLFLVGEFRNDKV